MRAITHGWPMGSMGRVFSSALLPETVLPSWTAVSHQPLILGFGECALSTEGV